MIMVTALCIASLTLLLLSFFVWLRRRSAWAVPAMVCLGIAELTLFALSARSAMPVSLGYPQQFLAAMQANEPGYRCLHYNSQFADSTMSSGQYDLWGYDPGVLRRYGQLISASQGISPDKASQYVAWRNPQVFGQLYRMLRLKWLLVSDDNQVRLGSLPNPMEQVQLVGACEVVQDRDQMFARLLDARFDPTRVVFLEEAPHIAPSGQAVVNGIARIISQNTDQLEIEAICDAPAILLVTDNYAKGWRVQPLQDSTQQDYQLLPANYCLRAVPLAAGKHHLLMEYRPAGWLIGKWVTAISLLAYCGVLYLVFHKDKSAEATV